MARTSLFQTLLNPDIRVMIYKSILKPHTINMELDSDQSALASLVEAIPFLENETNGCMRKWKTHRVWGRYNPETALFSCTTCDKDVLMAALSLFSITTTTIVSSKNCASLSLNTGLE